MPTYNSSVHNVKVQTWGTKDKKSNGMDNFVKQQLFGGNTGHASIVMTLPRNEETFEWMQKYCYKQTFAEFAATRPNKTNLEERYLKYAVQRIPVKLILPENTAEKTHEGLGNFQIEFSWWPIKNGKFSLSTTESDMRDEREGVHFEYSEKAKEYLQPEKRKHTGKVGSQIMTYAPNIIAHQRNLLPIEWEILNIRLEQKRVKKQLKIKELLTSKVDNIKTPKIEDSLKLMCANIDLNMEQLVDNYKKTDPKAIRVDRFKHFFRSEIESHFNVLEQKKLDLENNLFNILNKLEEFYNDLTDDQLKEVSNINRKQKKTEKEIERMHLLISKIDNITISDIEIESDSDKLKNFYNSLDTIFEEFDLDTEQLAVKYIKLNPEEEEKDLNPNKFLLFIRGEIGKSINDLKEKKMDLEKDLLDEIKEWEQLNDYRTNGTPPEHIVTLPYLTDDKRGLSPEAMLKKMYELSDPDGPGYNLRTNNCSTTSTKILTAGAEHDVLLKHTLSEQALGIFDTPQLVIGKAQTARKIIIEDKKNTLLSQIENIDFLQKSMGKLISIIMDPDTSKLKTGLAIVALVPIALARVPGVTLKTLMNPSETIENIVSGVSTVRIHAHSTLLKGVVALGCAVPLVALAPFALVEQGLKQIAKPFQTLANWLSKAPLQPLAEQITTPLPSAKEKRIESTRYHSMMASLVDRKVADNVKKNSMELTSKKTPLEILTNFEDSLKDNPSKVITLGDRDFDIIHKYIREKDNPNLTQRLQLCCNESLNRANKLSPKMPEKVDELIEEVTQTTYAPR